MMRRSKPFYSLIAALIVGISIVGAAAVVAQKIPNPADTEPVARDVENLSSIFRQVSKQVLPSVVSIETRGKSTRLTGGSSSLFDDDDPGIPEQFRNMPEFRDFFRRLPRTPDRRSPAPSGKGSGFIIDASGIILTNNHVVRDAEEVRVKLHDGRILTATDIKTDPRTDVAIIHVKGVKDLKPIRLGDSDATEVGDWVLAVGSPFGLDLTVTSGIISAKGRATGINEREDYLQTDAAINPGNSGGPLVNLKGEVVGINTAISSRSGGNQGVGFAVPVNMAKWVAKQLMDKGEVRRAYLGVSMQPMESALAARFGLQVNEGALVNQVVPESPAAAAKLETGDVVLEFNGQKVHGPRSLQGIVETLEPGKPYAMNILRGGKKMTVHVTPREMPRDYSRSSLGRLGSEPSKPQSEAKKGFSSFGMEVGDLTDDIRERLKLGAVKGVVITSVEDEGPAARAGLSVGDVIEKAENQGVNSVAEFQQAVKNAKPGEGLLLLVRSGGTVRFVTVK